jgi:hypothetical protein
MVVSRDVLCLCFVFVFCVCVVFGFWSDRPHAASLEHRQRPERDTRWHRPFTFQDGLYRGKSLNNETAQILEALLKSHAPSHTLPHSNICKNHLCGLWEEKDTTIDQQCRIPIGR